MKNISDKDYEDFLKFRHSERACLIDNLVRAGIITVESSKNYSTNQLEKMWQHLFL